MENSDDKYIFNIKLEWIKAIANTFLIIVLIVSVIGSGIASYYDYKYPFSCGKQVAQYIKKHYQNENIKIIGYHDYSAETVAGYLNKDIYYPEMLQYSQFVNWDTRNDNLSFTGAFKDIDSIVKDGETFLFIKDQKPISKEEKNLLKNKFQIVKEVDFIHSIVIINNLFLYKITKK